MGIFYRILIGTLGMLGILENIFLFCFMLILIENSIYFAIYDMSISWTHSVIVKM